MKSPLSLTGTKLQFPATCQRSSDLKRRVRRHRSGYGQGTDGGDGWWNRDPTHNSTRSVAVPLVDTSPTIGDSTVLSFLNRISCQRFGSD